MSIVSRVKSDNNGRILCEILYRRRLIQSVEKIQSLFPVELIYPLIYMEA